MLKLTLTIFAVLAVCSCDSDNFVFPPVGKCRDDIVSIPFDPFQIAGELRWKMYFGPDSPPYTDVDTVCRDVLDIFPDGQINVLDRFVMKNNNKIAYFFNYLHTSNIFAYEESVAGYCGTRKRQTFRNYVLDYTEEEFALLVYRCSDDGSEDIDVRSIVVPRTNNLTEASEQKLLAKDAEFGFKGDITRYRSTHGC